MPRGNGKAEKPSQRSTARTMHLNLRAGERVYINGAVVRTDRKVTLELMNDATFLLEGHVLQAEEATTPLRQLYFAAQTMLIDPAQAALARTIFETLRGGILAATSESMIVSGLTTAHTFVEAGRPFEALKVIRALYKAEAALIDGAQPAPILPATLQPSDRIEPRRPTSRPHRTVPNPDLKVSRMAEEVSP